MKFVLALCVVTLAYMGLAGSASCAERIQTAVEADRAEADRPEAVDCSKQVWPNFSPACLRNVDRATPVRTVTADRR